MEAVAAGSRQLKHLITGVLPLESVGPRLRNLARRAAAQGEPGRMRQVGRLVVGELLRRGDLIRVAVEGRERTQGDLFIVRATNRLVDLAPLSAAPAGGT